MILAKKAHAVMAFSEVERVVFTTNPLEEVICQVRFPHILKFDSDALVHFQESVIGQFPLYTLQTASPIGLPPGLTGIVGKEFPFAGGQSSHQFGSIDERFTLALDRESLALVCRRYQRWEEFRERLALGLAALSRQFPPILITRIGLRYKNVIRRSRLDLGSTTWADLLKPWIAGPYASSDVRDDIESNFSQTLLRLRDNRGKVLVNSGVVKDKDEECFLIDADFFLDYKTEAYRVLDNADYLNRESGRFFLWCITDRLGDALHPSISAV